VAWRSRVLPSKRAHRAGRAGQRQLARVLLDTDSGPAMAQARDTCEFCIHERRNRRLHRLQVPDKGVRSMSANRSLHRARACGGSRRLFRFLFLSSCSFSDGARPCDSANPASSHRAPPDLPLRVRPPEGGKQIRERPFTCLRRRRRSNTPATQPKAPPQQESV